MNPHLLIAITVVLATLIHFPALRCQEPRPYDICRESIECGDIDFEYPFWGLTRPVYCGHPDFQLTCQSDVPVLALGPVNYRVLDTDLTTHTITIARNDLWSNICPQYLHNTTYNSTLFDGNNFGQENVSLYYGCQDNIPSLPVMWPLAETFRFDCDVNGTGRTDSYFYRTSLVVQNIANVLVKCDNHITVPVDGSYANIGSENDLRSGLQAGFKLRWMANNDECDRCVRADGQCGSNSTLPELFACYHSEGGKWFSYLGLIHLWV
ncbi:hypothetical protein SSX86_025285 [Deinandra increscens subsp. villosa]|uniref:non-specific serine/threonine protein kinase n=1 Tax=Deinandra increscens subsp. villosa TaxID=3103831 RepID=A0AAP0GMT9_9ASTR